MRSRSRREMIEDIQYAAFWLANEIHSLPWERAFPTLLAGISDEAIDLAAWCNRAGRQIMAVLTDALATKLHGDPDNEYRLEWTQDEQLESEFLVVSALHMEALRRSGMLEVRSVPPEPWAPGASFEYRTRRGRIRRLDARGLMKAFLPDAWRCPPDYVISDATARRWQRRMSRRAQTTWAEGALFPSGPATKHVC